MPNLSWEYHILLYFKMVQTLIVFSALVAIAMAGGSVVPLDQAAKDAFVNGQNAYRKAAGGAGMPNLSWDNNLAAFAGKMAGKCVMEHAKNNVNGENIYWDWSPSFKNGADTAKKAVDAWKSEIQYVNRAWSCIVNGQCTHYSQMVWKKTTKVGCAIARPCHTQGYDWNLVFCEYSPKGNWLKDNTHANPPY